MKKGPPYVLIAGLIIGIWLVASVIAMVTKPASDDLLPPCSHEALEAVNLNQILSAEGLAAWHAKCQRYELWTFAGIVGAIATVAVWIGFLFYKGKLIKNNIQSQWHTILLLAALAGSLLLNASPVMAQGLHDANGCTVYVLNLDWTLERGETKYFATGGSEITKVRCTWWSGVVKTSTFEQSRLKWMWTVEVLIPGVGSCPSKDDGHLIDLFDSAFAGDCRYQGGPVQTDPNSMQGRNGTVHLASLVAQDPPPPDSVPLPLAILGWIAIFFILLGLLAGSVAIWIQIKRIFGITERLSNKPRRW